MRIIGTWKCKSDLLSLRIFLIFRIFFVGIEIGCIYLYTYIAAHWHWHIRLVSWMKNWFLEEKSHWSFMSHDRSKCGWSILIHRKYQKVHSCVKNILQRQTLLLLFFFKTIFFTDILTRIVAVLFSWVKVKREEKIRPKSTFQIKIANVKEIRESSFLRRIVKHSSLVVSSIVVYYGSKGLKNQSPRIIFQTTFFWKMNLQNCSKIVTKLPACCRKNMHKNTEPSRLILWQINCQWNHIFIVN